MNYFAAFPRTYLFDTFADVRFCVRVVVSDVHM